MTGSGVLRWSSLVWCKQWTRGRAVSGVGRPVRRPSHPGDSGWLLGMAGADGDGRNWRGVGAV